MKKTNSIFASSILLSLFVFGVAMADDADDAQAQAKVSKKQDASPVSVEKEGGEERFGASVSFSNSVGLGTFVRNDFSDSPYFGQSIGLSPSFQITDEIAASARWSLGWELTTPDNATGRRYSPSDVVLGVGHNELYKDERYTGIKASGSVSLDLPTSFASRFRRTITNVSTRLGLSRAFLSDKLSLTYGFHFKKYLPSQKTPGFLSDADQQQEIRDDEGNLLVSCSESRGLCSGTGGVNPDFSISNSFGIGYAITEKLSAGLSLGISHLFKFEVGEDFRVPGLPPRGRSDSTSGDISLSYQLTDMYSLSGGIASSQPALDSRNDGIRFPFFDFSSASNNFTQFYLSASASF